MKLFLDRYACKLLFLAMLAILPLVGSAQSIANAVNGTGQPPYRSGDRVRLIGAGLTAPCSGDSLILRWTLPTPSFVRLQDSTAPSETAFVITSSGLIDTITFLMPKAVPCGAVSATLKCGASSYSNTFTLPGNVGNKALIAYPRDTFCLNDNNSLPTRYEDGTFSCPTISSPFLNSFTGNITLHSGLVGNHVIKFVADQDPNMLSNPPGCRDSMTYTITINPNGPTQSIAYPAGKYCPAVPSFVVLATAPGAAGVFTSSPAGLNLSSSTGAIRPDSSATGTYLVTFTPEHDACSSPVSAPVEVDSIRKVIFSYPTGLCAGDDGLSPVVTQFYPGLFTANPLFGASGPLLVNGTTGVLDATSSLGGTYEVVYTPDTSQVNCDATTLAVVTVVAAPNSDFIIAQDSACTGGNDVGLTLVAPATVGTFHDRTNVVSFLTGPHRINVGGAAGGPLAITFVAQRTQAGVTCYDSTSHPFTVIAPQTDSILYPVQSLCAGGQDTLSPVFLSGTLGGQFFWHNTPGTNPPLDANTGQIILSAATPPGTYTAKYRYAGYNICRDSLIMLPIVLNERPRMEFFFPTTLFDSSYHEVCVNDSNAVVIYADTAVGYSGPVSSRSVELFGSSAGSPLPLSTVNPQVLPYVVGVGGPYPIVFSAGAGGCNSYDTIYLKVKEFYSSAFDYLDDYACQGGSNPVPHIIGSGGGIFTQLSSLNLDPDSTTGEIDISILDTVNGTQLFIQYSTFNLDPVCSDVSVDSILIIGNNSADFTYNAVSFCQSDAQVLYPFFPGTTDTVTAGTFVVTLGDPDSLIIHPTTGVIDVLASFPGTYTIQNTVGAGTTCVSQFSLSVTILPGFDSTYMSYSANTYCEGQSNPQPYLFGDNSGVFIGTSGINLINAAGQIDLSNSIPNDSVPYIIEYRLENDDGCVLSFYDTLLIRSKGTSFFEYDPGFICSTTDTVSLSTPPSNTVGVFTLRNHLFALTPAAINAATGDIYPQFLDATSLQRQVIVYFTPDTTECADPHQQSLTFVQGPDSANIRVTPDSIACARETVRIEALGTLDGAWFTVNDSIPRAWEQLSSNISSSQYINNTRIEVVLFTGVLDTLEDANGDYVTASGGAFLIDESKICFVKRSVTLEIKPLPELTLLDAVEVLTADQPAIFGLSSSMDLTSVSWLAKNDTTPGNAAFQPDRRTEAFDIANLRYVIQNQVTLMAPNSPAQAEYIFTPSADGCTGTPLVYHLNVNPGGEDVFVPEVFTPDGDDFNETWYIQVRSGIDPNNYTLELFNRAGGLVFKMDPLNTTWDGGDLPDGVYWWSLRDRQGNSVDKGGLTIRRK